MARALAKLGQLDAKSTIFLLCDLQEKFRPGMKLFDPMIKNVNKLVKLNFTSLISFSTLNSK